MIIAGSDSLEVMLTELWLCTYCTYLILNCSPWRRWLLHCDKGIHIDVEIVFSFWTFLAISFALTRRSSKETLSLPFDDVGWLNSTSSHGYTRINFQRQYLFVMTHNVNLIINNAINYYTSIFVMNYIRRDMWILFYVTSLIFQRLSYFLISIFPSTLYSCLKCTLRSIRSVQ